MYCFERGGGIYNTQEINNEGYAVLEVHQVGGGRQIKAKLSTYMTALQPKRYMGGNVTGLQQKQFFSVLPERKLE